MILPDTSVWVDFLRGVPTPEALFLKSALGMTPIFVGDLILCEVLQGVPTTAGAKRVERLLRESHVVNMVDDRIASAAVANVRTLRARGFTIRKTMDVLIGTYCIQEKMQLLHRDRDFDAMEQHLGLRVLHA